MRLRHFSCHQFWHVNVVVFPSSILSNADQPGSIRYWIFECRSRQRQQLWMTNFNKYPTPFVASIFRWLILVNSCVCVFFFLCLFRSCVIFLIHFDIFYSPLLEISTELMFEAIGNWQSRLFLKQICYNFSCRRLLFILRPSDLTSFALCESLDFG